MDPQRELFIALCIAAVAGRAPLMLIVIAVLDNHSTNRMRYTVLGAAVAIAIAVDGTMLYNYSVHEMYDLIRQFSDSYFKWALVACLGCADTVLFVPLAARRIRRKPNRIAHAFFSQHKLWLIDGVYVPSPYSY